MEEGEISKSIIMMGVAGSGKSTIGESLARTLRVKFIEGDDLHPKANILKMESGKPLTDEDRTPWLARIRDCVFSLEHKSEVAVIVCSALKRNYRDQIRQGNSGVLFIFLDGSFDLILSRLKTRVGHYFPEALLKSQFEDLEKPKEEEDAVRISTEGSATLVLNQCLEILTRKMPLSTRTR